MWKIHFWNVETQFGGGRFSWKLVIIHEILSIKEQDMFLNLKLESS